MEIHEGKVFNGAVLVDKLGNLKSHFREGDVPTVVSTRFGNVCICSYQSVLRNQNQIKNLHPSLTIIPFGVVEPDSSKWPVSADKSIPHLGEFILVFNIILKIITAQSLAKSLETPILGKKKNIFQFPIVNNLYFSY